MSSIHRQSPIHFDHEASASTVRAGWNVVLEFVNQGEGPWLVDLSHLQRWDYQHADLDSCRPFGMDVPAEPGQALLQDQKLITRMNRTQVTIWILAGNHVSATPEAVNVTELTDAHCMLAVTGNDAARVMEHVSNLDLFRPDRQMPFLTQGPVMHIPCQAVTVDMDCVLMTFSRGYGQSFADAMLHAASGCRLRPGGEEVFARWLSRK